MFIAAKRFLELESKLERLDSKVETLKADWDKTRIDLADIEEKVLNTLKRLQARERRATPAETPPDNGEQKRDISPAAQRLLGITR